MTDKEENTSNPAESRPYKVEQFDAFIATIKGGAVGHWIQIARIIGVDRATINEWKKLPQAQKAIKDAIDNTMDKMMEVGKDDWKMWESKMKMLGVSPIEKTETDLTSDGEKITPILAGITKDVQSDSGDTETGETKKED